AATGEPPRERRQHPEADKALPEGPHRRGKQRQEELPSQRPGHSARRSPVAPAGQPVSEQSGPWSERSTGAGREAHTLRGRLRDHVSPRQGNSDVGKIEAVSARQETDPERNEDPAG